MLKLKGRNLRRTGGGKNSASLCQLVETGFTLFMWMWLTLIKVFLCIHLVFLENKYQEPWNIKNPEEALPWHLMCLFCDVQSSEDRGLFPLKKKGKVGAQPTEISLFWLKCINYLLNTTKSPETEEGGGLAGLLSSLLFSWALISRFSRLLQLAHSGQSVRENWGKERTHNKCCIYI